MSKCSMGALLLLLAMPANAQKTFTLQEALGGFGIRQERPATMVWMKDGVHYQEMVRDDAGKTSVVAVAVKDDSREVILTAEQLTNPETGKPFQFRSYEMSADNKKALLYTNTKRVWRQDTRGDYWVLDRESGKLAQLGKGLPESSLMFAKFSPDGTRVAYVSKNNIYVEDVATMKYTKITTDGNDEIVNGTSDWVYEEEFGLRDCFRWSGDGESIAYWQFDTSGTGWFSIINNVDYLYPEVTKFPYPKAGTTNSAAKIGFVSAKGGTTTWLPIPGDPRNNYLPRMEFIPNSNTMFIQQMNREQNTNKIWTYTIGQNDLKNIYVDQDKAWVETNNNIHWLQNKKQTWFTFMSERSGYRHMYRVLADGSKTEAITKGDFDFISEVGFDVKRGFVYFMATEKNFTQRYLYRAKIWGNGECERLTPMDQEGTHSYRMSPTCDYAVHTWSNTGMLPKTELLQFPKGNLVKVMATNEEAQKQWNALGLPKKEFVRTHSSDIDLDAYWIKPANFDPNKKYPVILDIYGEPASSTVQDGFSTDGWHQYLAQLGYIVMSIDPRGANTPRGREWRKCIYGEVGTFASKDIAEGISNLAKEYSFIDAERIGVTGWSGGGAQTLNCMFRYPNVFKTGIAVAFVADEKLYDTIYQERYMNTPQNNPEGYKKGSPITYAAGLTDKQNLLLMHGTGDDNVHYQSTERLVNELVKNGKTFYQIVYPMRTHGISEGAGTSLHVRKTMADFWLKNLPAGAK